MSTLTVAVCRHCRHWSPGTTQHDRFLNNLDICPIAWLSLILPLTLNTVLGMEGRCPEYLVHCVNRMSSHVCWKLLNCDYELRGSTCCICHAWFCMSWCRLTALFNIDFSTVLGKLVGHIWLVQQIAMRWHYSISHDVRMITYLLWSILLDVWISE